jgi:hypothetical protein
LLFYKEKHGAREVKLKLKRGEEKKWGKRSSV